MIVTRRLVLRPWSTADGDTLAALLANPDVMADIGGPVSRSASDTKLQGFRNAYDAFGICKWAVLKDGEFIGYCGVMPGAPDYPLGPHYEIGWRLMPNAWGQGFATEAANAAMDDALGRAGLDEVVAYTSPDNHRSQAVIARLGMVRDEARDFALEDPRIGTWHGLVWTTKGMSAFRAV